VLLSGSLLRLCYSRLNGICKHGISIIVIVIVIPVGVGVQVVVISFFFFLRVGLGKKGGRLTRCRRRCGCSGLAESTA
jgi:hypothetical protein